MTDYEMMVIVHPDVDEDGMLAVQEQISQWISNQGGEVLKVDVWGRRKLAYPIRKQLEGSYVVMDMRIPGANLLELERNLKLHERILRYLIVRKAE